MKILWKFENKSSHSKMIVGISVCCYKMANLLRSGQLISNFDVDQTAPTIKIEEKLRNGLAVGDTTLHLHYCPNCGEKYQVIQVTETEDTESVLRRIFN